MRRRRGYTLVECITAIALVLVLVPALFPSIQAELARITELYEREAVRLILEGELARASADAETGWLESGGTITWTSARRLPDLRLERRPGPTRDGVAEVTVTASWRSRALGGARREMTLTTWVRRP